jgi:trehalose-6-phosphatase
MQRLDHINKSLVIIDYSGILFSGSVHGLVSTLLDTKLNIVTFFILSFTIIVIILTSRYNKLVSELVRICSAETLVGGKKFESRQVHWEE